MSPPTASACWFRPRACCSWSTGFEDFGFAKSAAWTAGYLAMAVLVVIGIVTALLATEPEKSAGAEAAHAAQAATMR